jgi:hypothetical protein
MLAASRTRKPKEGDTTRHLVRPPYRKISWAMGVDLLKSAVAELLRGVGLDEAEVPSKEKILADHPRITWDRQVGKYRRYAQFTPLSDFPGKYGILFGQWVGDANGGYGVADPEQFDARRLGDLDYCLAFLGAWLVECVDWRALPRPPGA